MGVLGGQLYVFGAGLISGKNGSGRSVEKLTTNGWVVVARLEGWHAKGGAIFVNKQYTTTGDSS